MYTGIDIGITLTAFVYLDDNNKVCFEESFGSAVNDPLKYAVHDPLTRRLPLYKKYLIRTLEKHPLGTVVIERVTRTRGNARILLHLEGIFLSTLPEYVSYLKIIEVYPTQVKKGFAGNSFATKEQMIEKCKKIGYFPRNHHFADAYALAYCGRNNLI